MKSAGRWLVAIAVTVGLLWWSLKGTDWSALWADITGADIPLVVLAVVVGNLIFPLRAIRWRPILDPVAPGIPYGKLWRATAIGFMANHLLPFRAGEVVRPFMLSRDADISFSTAFASLVVDRVFDAFVVFLLVALALFAPGFPGGLGMKAFASTTLIGMIAIGVGLYLIVFAPEWFMRTMDRAVSTVMPRFRDPINRLVKSFVDGLAVLRDLKRFLTVFAWALLLWLVQAVAFWIMFKALGITAPFSAALIVQGLIVLSVALPSTPGYFGAFEAAAKLGLGVYGVSETQAIAWALPFHILSLLPITLIGLYYLARSDVSLRDLKNIGA